MSLLVVTDTILVLAGFFVGLLIGARFFDPKDENEVEKP